MLLYSTFITQFHLPVAIECPESRPYALNSGQSCCKYFRRKTMAPFDGGVISYTDPPEGNETGNTIGR